MTITLIPVYKDNYAYLMELQNGKTAVIDPGESAPVIKALEEKGRSLDYILNTHHHWDHVDGNLELKQHYGCDILGPKNEPIPGRDRGLEEGNSLSLGGEEIQIIHTPGHTLGHLCYYFPGRHALFSGDTLFSMGCGRLFEGTAEDMWNGFQKLLALPEDTKVYCGHEYTLANAAFCSKMEPENQDIKQRREEVKERRRKKRPTLPTTLATEKKTNLFLMAKNADDFAEIRKAKDTG